jgi:hypothetical protein
MEKIIVTFPIRSDKKHSIRYDCKDQDAAVSAIYISRKALGSIAPKAVKITIEEV